jgi:hypothetical protein
MNLHTAIRILTGLTLGTIATIILYRVPNAHVTMCMIGAIGYSVGLLTNRTKIASHFFSWVLFYTVYTATTMMALGIITNTMPTDVPSVGFSAAWIYHTAINVVLLLLFWLKMENIKHIWNGFAIAMMAAPLMVVLEKFGRDLFPTETLTVILIYATIGLILFLSNKYWKISSRYSSSIKSIIKISLYIYLALTLIPLIFGVTE